jgi:uncharacterized surface protein with fasciclin (FAS1) repeats
MKINFSFSRFTAILGLVLLFASPACNKTNNPSGTNGATSTITSLLKSATNATVFYSGMTRTGLDTILNGAGPFTVFVPTDSAFGVVGINNITIANLPSDSLRKIFLYHVLSGVTLLSTTFPQVTAAKIITASGDSVFISNTSAGLFVNGIPVTDEDIIVSNGVIQAVAERPLLPPTGNLMDLLNADTSFSYLVTAINRASQGTTNVLQQISTGGPYTLLAPVNSGFRQYGLQTLDDINNANADSLALILQYHLVVGRTFASDISSGQSFITAMQDSVLFTSTGIQRQVKGIGNDVNANVLSVNSLARNGVMFSIDQVLVP